MRSCPEHTCASPTGCMPRISAAAQQPSSGNEQCSYSRLALLDSCPCKGATRMLPSKRQLLITWKHIAESGHLQTRLLSQVQPHAGEPFSRNRAGSAEPSGVTCYNIVAGRV